MRCQTTHNISDIYIFIRDICGRRYLYRYAEILTGALKKRSLACCPHNWVESLHEGPVIIETVIVRTEKNNVQAFTVVVLVKYLHRLLDHLFTNQKIFIYVRSAHS